MISQKIVEVLKPRECYFLFLCVGGSTAEFELLPKPVNVGDDVLYVACRAKVAVQDGISSDSVVADACGGMFEAVCGELNEDTEIGVEG